MKQFLRYLYVVAAMLMVVVGDVWAECYVLDEPAEYNKTIGKSQEYSLGSKPGAILSFTAKKRSLGTGKLRVDQKINGSWQEGVWSDGLTTSWKDYNNISISRYATEIRLYNTGTLNKDFKNVKVTWATYADQPSDTSWTADSKIIGSPAETTTITMAWSNTAAFSCEITGGGKDRFSAEITEGNASTCSYGTAKILVKYKHDVVGTHNASLKISNGTYTYNISLSGTTLDKYTATFNWLLQDSYYVEDEKSLLDEVYSLVDKDGNNIKNQFHSSIQFSSSDPNVVAIEDGKIVAKNAGDAKITAYFPGTNEWFGFTKEINLTIKKRPTNFSVKTLSSCYTGDEFAISSLFNTTTNNPEVALEYISGDESILKVEDGKLIAVCAGTTTFTVRQQENYKWLGHSQTLTITVNKYNSNFNLLQTQYTRKIGEVITEAQLYTHSNTEILPTVVSDNPAVVSFNASTRQLEAKTAGQAIITISQPEDCKWTHYNVTCTVTVQKHTPVFTWNDPVYFNQSLIEDYFATSNKDTKINITNQTDREVADLYFSKTNSSDLHTLDLTTYNKEASTKVTVSQEENWYWYAKSEEHTITPIDPNNHVPFVMNTSSRRIALFYDKEDDNGEITCSDGGEIRLNQNSAIVWTANPLYYTIKFTGVPNKLSFDYKQTASSTAIGATGKAFIVYESSDGSSWNEIWTSNGMPGNTDYESKSNIQLNPGTRYLKFFFDATYSGYYKNITVTEREEFSAVDKVDGDKHLDFGANQVQSTKTLKFDLKYANVGYKVTAESNNNRFTVTPAINTEIGGEYNDKYEYTVKYTSDVLYETVGDESYILLEDELGNSDKIYLHASSYKASQNITWREDFAAVDEPAIRKSDGQITNAAKASSGLTVTYTSEDPDIIEVIDDGKVLLPKKAGRVKITASQAGNSDTWEAASNKEKWFIVTDKMLQYILWSDALTDLTEDDINTTKVLGAKVYVQVNAEGYEVEYSETQTSKIEYESADSSIVSVEGNILTIHSTGQTTLTVRVTEYGNYAAVSLVVPVMVKAKPVGCADELLLEHKDEVSFFAYNTNEIVQGPFAIDRDKGVPGTLEFQHYGASWDLGIQYYSGTIKAQYTTDDNSNWVDAKEVTPKEDQATTETGIALPRNATQIRFVRPSGGTGYHYVSNIQVHPAQYLETEDNVEEVNFGEILIGSTVTTSLNINYSNIKSEIYPVLSSNELSTDPVVFGQCGAFGTQTLNISWRPSVASDAVEETLTLRDELTGMVKEVKLTAIVIKGEQKITWSRPGTITTCLEFPEETDVHVAVEWEMVSGEDCASFEGNMLNIYKSGNIQVKGSAAESDNYKAYSIVYNFVVDYNPTYIGDDGNWNDSSNWNICRVPLEEEIVTIQAALEINSSITTKGIILAENATIHITSTGGLTVGVSGIVGAKEDGTSIFIDNSPEGAGFLRVDPTTDNKPAKVTVNYTTEAYNSGNPRDEVWQYMGAPGSNMQMSDTEKTTIYHWDEVKGWVKQSGASLTPFVGYAFTQNKADSATFTVTATPIIPTEVQEIELTVTPTGMGGSNLFVNSFLAPIDLAKFDDKDFTDGVEQTFYLYNSGSWKQWQNNGGANNQMNCGVSPGQYYAITQGSAAMIDASQDQTTIPPMQGVYVIAREKGAKIKLDYAKHVYAADASNQPMRAPQRISEDFKRVRLHVNSQNSGADRMYVIQHEAGTAGYDNGYDARNMAVNGQVAIYTHEVEGQMEISVSNNIDSTYIGFRAGSDSEYTLRMTSVVGEELYLKDLSEDLLIPVVDGQDYTFTATPNSVNDTRFLLLTQKSGVATDVEALQVYIHDNLVHVIEAPENSSLVIYTIGGVAVANYSIGSAPCTIDLCGLPTGVYVLRINDKAYKFVCK